MSHALGRPELRDSEGERKLAEARRAQQARRRERRVQQEEVWEEAGDP